jgi:hypothetical protein
MPSRLNSRWDYIEAYPAPKQRYTCNLCSPQCDKLYSRSLAYYGVEGGTKIQMPTGCALQPLNGRKAERLPHFDDDDGLTPMPSFFVPEVPPDMTEDRWYATLAAFAQRSVQLLAQRIYSITYRHNGDEWTSTFCEESRATRTREMGRGAKERTQTGSGTFLPQRSPGRGDDRKK